MHTIIPDRQQQTSRWKHSHSNLDRPSTLCYHLFLNIHALKYLEHVVRNWELFTLISYSAQSERMSRKDVTSINYQGAVVQRTLSRLVHKI